MTPPSFFDWSISMIEVRLFATLREGRGKVIMLSADQFSTAGDIIHSLAIPAEEVAILLINGFHKKPEDHVKAGDVVALFPPVGGG